MAQPGPTPRQRTMTEAEEMYILMKEEYRISRNTRASWFFNHLNEPVVVKDSHKLLESNEELEVLSILPIVEELTHDEEEPAPSIYQLVPCTHVSFLARRYRMVFILDFSPSMASVIVCAHHALVNCITHPHTPDRDIQLGKVNLLNSFICLSNCLRGLIQPFCVPGSSLILSPKIYMTVLAYTPLSAMTTQQVLLQGRLLSAEAIDDILQDLQKEVENFENKLFNNMSDTTQDGSPSANQVEMALPESCFMNMIWCGILALQLLPVNTSAGIVVITDGVIGVREDPILNNALAQLRDSTIACSFIQVGHGFLPHSPFGFIPHTEIMQFIAAATMGSFLDECPDVSEDSSYDMNIYHAALLVWSFQKDLNPLKGYQQSMNSSSLFEPITSSQAVGVRMPRSPNLPLQRVKHREEALQTGFFNVMAVRLREGYSIKHVTVFKSKGLIEARLALPCTHSGQIEYVVKAPWPPPDNRRVTHIEVVMEGTYEFIHDINCPLNRKETRSFFKTRVIKNFWQMIRSLRDTDKLLVHMHSFNANPAYYQVPEGTGKGMPLFYMPPNSDNPVLAQQHDKKDDSLHMFAEFWKRIALMEPKLWQRWLHTHKIALLLMPDLPLPKHLHHPNSSGRFGNVQCKLAQKELNALLREWSTFILLENHSYINITYEDKNSPPASFFIIRVVCKGLTVVLRLAFLGGTPPSVRYKLVNELKNKLAGLSMSQKLIHSKDPTRITKGRKSSLKGEVPKPTLRKPCVLLLQRPVEVILVKYEKLPSDFTDLKLSSEVTVPSVPVYMNRGPDKKLNRLSCYLNHRRWIWDAQGDQPLQIKPQDVLSVLTRFKLQQGFHIAYSQSGIISFIAELQLKSPLLSKSDVVIVQPVDDVESVQIADASHLPESDQLEDDGGEGRGTLGNQRDTESASDKEEIFRCCVQYVIFPPHLQTLSKMQDTDADPFEDIDMSEADGKLQLITECWVEPQCGTVMNSPAGRAFFDGREYSNIPDLLFPMDDEIVRTLLSYEHLKAMCSPKGEESVSVSPPVSSSNVPTSESITTFPFSLDILHLIPKCRQLELTCSTFLEGAAPLHREGLRYPRPNQTLFSLLLESLSSEQTTDIELSLTPKQSLEFCEFVLERRGGEDAKPFQMTIEEIHEILRDVEKLNAQKRSRARSGSELGESRGSVRRDRADTIDEMDVLPKIPHWTCFLRTVTETVFLVLLPASHEDLLKLQGKAYVPLVEEESDSSALGVRAQEKGALKEGDPKSKENQASQSRRNSQESKAEKVPKGKRRKHKKSKKISCEEQKISFNLPIFVYECSLNSLTRRLLTKEPDRMPKDISKDISFGSSERGSIPGTPRTFRRFSQLPPTDSDDLSESSKKGSSGVLVDSDKPHMTREMEWFFPMLSNKVHKSFVVAVFKSLQLGQDVDRKDVSAAIENICSESLYEIDITSYIQAVCGHVREATEVVEGDGVLQDRCSRKLTFATEADGTDKPTAAADEKLEEAEDRPEETEDDETATFESPKREVSYRIPVSAFLARQTCEVQSGLHSLIKNKFSEIMGRSFRQIPANENLWFYSLNEEDDSPIYSSQSQVTTQDEVETSGTELAGERDSQPATAVASDNSQVEITSGAESSSKEEDRNINSIVDNYMTMKIPIEGTLSEADDSIMSQHGSVEEDISPLFVTLVCTINMKSNVGNMPVQTIPTCLGVLLDCLERPEEEISLGDLRLTLDLICLTLPADFDSCTPYEDDDSEHSDRRRGTSFTETSPPDSPPAMTTRGNGRGGMKLFSVSEYDNLPSGYVDDTLESLPEHQKSAIQDTQDEIKWLLKDEIASARRHIYPVTVSTLDMVAHHVCNSPGRDTCLYKQVDLKFVFGPEQSLSEFIKAFEEIKVVGFILNKIHENYYLSLDPVSPNKDLDGSWPSDQFEGNLPFPSKSNVTISVTETRERSLPG